MLFDVAEIEVEFELPQSDDEEGIASVAGATLIVTFPAYQHWKTLSPSQLSLSISPGGHKLGTPDILGNQLRTTLDGSSILELGIPYLLTIGGVATPTKVEELPKRERFLIGVMIGGEVRYQSDPISYDFPVH